MKTGIAGDFFDDPRQLAPPRALRSEGGGTSQVPVRALVLDEPPSADAGEITDKGYIDQGAVLARRVQQVEPLHAGGTGVIRP